MPVVVDDLVSGYPSQPDQLAPGREASERRVLERSQEDLHHALWLMRISYLRYALKSAPDAHKLLERESRELRLSPQLRSLLGQFVPREQVAS